MPKQARRAGPRHRGQSRERQAATGDMAASSMPSGWQSHSTDGVMIEVADRERAGGVDDALAAYL